MTESMCQGFPHGQRCNNPATHSLKRPKQPNIRVVCEACGKMILKFDAGRSKIVMKRWASGEV